MSAEHLDRRVALARAHVRTIDADALFVSHLPNLAWLTGFFASSGGLLLTLADPALHLITDFRYAHAAGRLGDRGQLPSDTRITITDRSVDEAAAALVETAGCEAVAVESDHLTLRRARRLEARLPKGARLVATDPFLEQMRAIKDGVELRIYREAAARLAEVARRVPALLGQGRSERDIAADIDHAIKRGGFDRTPFDTIVASGPNSALPHARPTSRRLRGGDPVVLDFGGVYKGYCVDLTRTAFVGHPTKEFLGVFDAVSAAQAAAIAAVRDGIHASAVDAAARQVLADRGLGEAFGHATGHGLGIDVHEYPRIGAAPPDGEDPIIRAGMIVTIEPGAYRADLGGVRIEDDVHVLPGAGAGGGAEILTDIPRGLMIPGAQ